VEEAAWSCEALARQLCRDWVDLRASTAADVLLADTPGLQWSGTRPLPASRCPWPPSAAEAARARRRPEMSAVAAAAGLPAGLPARADNCSGCSGGPTGRGADRAGAEHLVPAAAETGGGDRLVGWAESVRQVGYTEGLEEGSKRQQSGFGACGVGAVEVYLDRVWAADEARLPRALLGAFTCAGASRHCSTAAQAAAQTAVAVEIAAVVVFPMSTSANADVDADLMIDMRLVQTVVDKR
jgi:hypothetical protein